MSLINKLLKYWNKTSGVIIVISPDNILNFIEIKGLFLFKLLTLFNVRNNFHNYRFVYSEKWEYINRLVEYKNSEDPIIKDMLKDIIDGI